MNNIIEVGLSFKLHEKNYTLTKFKDGLPLITCKETGQEQRISDTVLKKLLKGGDIKWQKQM